MRGGLVWSRLRSVLAGVCAAALAGFCGGERTMAADEPAVTYNQQIAPILNRNCVGCHHTGGTAPFSLQTLPDVQRWSQQILSATQTRYMPPWLPEAGYGEFEDVHRLSDEEIAAIKRWIDSGMPADSGTLAGSGAAAGAAASGAPLVGEWALGKPDLVLTAQPAAEAGNASAAAASEDSARRWMLRNPSNRPLHLRALEISFGGSQAVQEARIDVCGRAKPGAGSAPAPGPASPGGGPVFWTPNSPAVVEPTGMPLLSIPAGGSLTVTARLTPQGSSESSEIAAPRMALFLARGGVAGQALTVELSGDKEIAIPAGAKDFAVEQEMTLPVAVDVLSVYPQAHLLGRELQAYATLPGGQRRWLLWIRNWDVERAGVYRYKRQVALPRGSVVHMRYTYDNSAENTHNPSDPPRAVSAGEAETSEVAHLWLRVGLRAGARGTTLAEAARLLARAASTQTTP